MVIFLVPTKRNKLDVKTIAEIKPVKYCFMSSPIKKIKSRNHLKANKRKDFSAVSLKPLSNKNDYIKSFFALMI